MSYIDVAREIVRDQKEQEVAVGLYNQLKTFWIQHGG